MSLDINNTSSNSLSPIESSKDSANLKLRSLLKTLIDDNVENNSKQIPNIISKIIPEIIGTLVSEYEETFKKSIELEEIVKELRLIRDIERDVFIEALNSDHYSTEKLALMPAESRQIISNFVEMRKKINDIDLKLENLKDQIKTAQIYIEEYSLKSNTKPILIDEFKDLINVIDGSMNRISENLRVNLYSQISSALSLGNSDSVSSDLLELINKLIIDRLESTVKPYEE